MKKIILISFVAILFASCYYDKNSELHPGGGISIKCDTVSPITYSGKVMDIVNSYCISCHYENAIPSYDFTTWKDLNAAALNRRLIESLKFQSGHPPMPPLFQLDSCTIRMVEIWVNAGAPNN